MTIQEERLRHLLHQAAPDSTVTIDFQAIGLKVRRRRRAKILLSAVAIVAVAGVGGLTFAALSDGTAVGEQRITATPGPSEPRPIIYTGVATIIKPAAGPAQLCLGVQFQVAVGRMPFATKPNPTAAPTCSAGVSLRGLVLDQLPDGSTQNGMTQTQPLRVTGTYQDGIFTLTQPPQVTKDRPTELWFTSLPLPCAAPAGGWSDKPMTYAEQELVTNYEGTRPGTWAGSWLLNNQRIFVAAFTRDLDSARHALRPLADHVCITKAARTYLDMSAVADTFKPTPAEMGRLHININGASIDEVHSQLVIGVVLADQPVTSYIAEHFKPGLVRLQPFLTPVSR